MKIFDNKTITGPQPKFVEFGDKLLINTNTYDLQTLSQIPYSNLTTVPNAIHTKITTGACSSNKMHINPVPTTYNTNNQYIFMGDYNSKASIMDEYEPDTYYIVYDCKVDRNVFLYKYRIVDNDLVFEKGLTLSYSTKYLCQDEENLYFAVANNSNGSNLTVTNSAVPYHIVKIDKLTFTRTNCNLIDSGTNIVGIPSLIHFDDDYIFLNVTHQHTVYVVKYDKKNNSVTSEPIVQVGKSNRAIRDFVVNTYTVDDYKYIYVPNLNNSTDDNIIPGMTCAKLDFSIDKAISTTIEDVVECTINWSGFEKEELLFNNSVKAVYMCRPSFVTYNGEKTYISFFIHYACLQASKEVTGIYTFEIITPTELKFVSLLNMNGSERTPLFLGGDNITEIYVPTDFCIYYLRFNFEKQGFEIINTKPILASSIGVDTCDRVWAMDVNNQLHMYSESVVEKINLRFTDVNLEYIGEDINSNVIVNCTNNLDEKIDFNVELTITGNAIFSNNSRKIIVTTIRDNDLYVPIKITGPGQISIYPKAIL